MLAVLALLACASPESCSDREDPRPPPVAVDPAPTSSETAAVDPTTLPPAPAPIDIPGVSVALGDCGGGFVTPGPYPNQLQQGDDLHRIVLQDPAALCNDGTPGVVYVRAATEPAHASDWVLHLQGGSHCTTYEECEKRWCGGGFYDASKMSSSWTPESIAGAGIFHEDGRVNDFSCWNQVFFYYCSSDVWQGQGSATLTSVDGAKMALERRGHLIFSAAIASLEAGASSDDGAATLPSILGASQVLLTGTSGGSVGAQLHLDWLRERWPPSVGLLGVFDAALSPAPESVPVEVSDRVDAALAAEHAQTVVDSFVLPWGDESCEAAIAPEDEWQCSQTSRLPYQWITTPFMVRMDQFDPITGAAYEAAGATSDQFAAGVVQSLLHLAGMSVAGRNVGVYGPACAIHVGLESNVWFLDRAIETDGGPVTLDDAVLGFAQGADVAAIDLSESDAACKGPE
jgi:hypothetical protein